MGFLARTWKLTFLSLAIAFAQPSAFASDVSRFCAWAFRADNNIPLGNNVLVATKKLQTLRRSESFQGESDLPAKFSGKHGLTTRSSAALTPVNIDTLLRLPLGETTADGFGGKAVVFRDRDGQFHAVFWNTFQNGSPNQIHHRDVMAAIMLKRAATLEEESEGQVLAGYKAFAQMQSLLLRDAADILGGESSTRNHESFPESILEEMQGFQLTARPANGVLKVTNLDVSSSLTSAQVDQGLTLEISTLFDQIAVVHEEISPSLRAYRSIGLSATLYDQLGAQGDLEALRERVRQLKSFNGHPLKLSRIP